MQVMRLFSFMHRVPKKLSLFAASLTEAPGALFSWCWCTAALICSQAVPKAVCSSLRSTPSDGVCAAYMRAHCRHMHTVGAQLPSHPSSLPWSLCRAVSAARFLVSMVLTPWHLCLLSCSPVPVLILVVFLSLRIYYAHGISRACVVGQRCLLSVFVTDVLSQCVPQRTHAVASYTPHGVRQPRMGSTTES